MAEFLGYAFFFFPELSHSEKVLVQENKKDLAPKKKINKNKIKQDD